MKKTLLLSFSGLLAVSALAESGNKVFTEASFQCMSPNGRYIVGDRLGALSFYDRETNKLEILSSDDYEYEYVTGLGNRVSNDGIVLCNQQQITDAPTYYYNGQWYKVDAPKDTYYGSQLHGITPDGSRIVGSIDATNLPDGNYMSMQTPAYWDRQDDGSYGEYHILPYPEKDFTGRYPQYVTATCVSDDGKVVAGQVVDRTGMYIQPIVYTQADNGEWSYTLPLESVFDASAAPEQPGDEPEQPTAKGMFTAEQLAQYNADMQTWRDNGSVRDDKPKAEDYLTEEQVAELAAATEKYEEEYAAWEEKMYAYNDFWDNLPRYAVNDIRMSPDGKVITTNKEVAYSRWESTYIPNVINLETGDVTSLEFDNVKDALIVTQVINENTFLAFNTLMALTPKGYVIKDGVCTDLYDYLCATSSATKEWAEEVLRHEYSDYDEELDDYVTMYNTCTGLPCASADMTVFAFGTTSDYWGTPARTPYAYVVDLSTESGLSKVSVTADSKLGFDANGNIVLGDDLRSAQVYDLSGRLVVADGESASSLSSGIYIIRALRNDGSTVAAKVRK